MPFDKHLVKELLLTQREKIKNQDLGVERESMALVNKQLRVPHSLLISGLRRSGKSTFLAQIARKFYRDKGWYYVNFDDNRFLNFTASDFDALLEILFELFGEHKVFFFDEVQNIPAWETFTRRLIDEGYKVYVTGSNSKLLSKEFGTRLTGRNTLIEMFPFSFTEFLVFYNAGHLIDSSISDTKKRALLKKYFMQYMHSGAIPEALRYPEIPVLERLYSDTVYRDIIARYNIESEKSIRDLGYFLFSNITSPFSYTKLKGLLNLRSVTTIKNYVDHFESSWLLFTLNQFSVSVKKQQMSPKKVYAIDTGLAKESGFSISENYGVMLENIVFLFLRKHEEDIFYYKTEKNHEVDFFLRRSRELYQVCWDLDDTEVRERELRALIEAKSELKAKKLFIISFDHREEITHGKDLIKIIPIYEWLLEKH